MLCAVALILLMDGSGSMGRDFNTQREQTAAALESPEVVEAIERQGAVAVSVMQFSHVSRIEVNWQVLRSQQDARMVANAIRQINYMDGQATNIAGALTDAHEQMGKLTQCQPDSNIIDLSTDGIDFSFSAIEAARDASQIAGYRINIIAVGRPEDADLLERHAMTSDGFTLHTESWANYPALFRRKIIFELAGLSQH